MNTGLCKRKERESGIELFRIITMLLIIAHHYVVNSGVIDKILVGEMTANKLFLIIYGGFGKIGINCFVLITGYFMCTQKISFRKFLKLVCEILFYNIIIYIVFLITKQHFLFILLVENLLRHI